jgi:hypothetical protein
MKSYDVRLVRTVSQKVRTTVPVEAGTEAEAITKAKAKAENHPEIWSVTLGEREVSGDIEVEAVEEIVELEE